MAGSRTLKLSILADVDDLNKKLKTANGDVEGFTDRLGKFGKIAAAAFAAAAAAAAYYAVKIGKEAVKAASDFNETQSKVGVIFGQNAKQIEAFANTAATSLGQTKTQALEASANFAIFGQAAGLTGDNLVKFSTGFTTLASDLASFNNTSPQDAILAIGSALRGEAEPLRRYGVLLNDATLKAAALELGIYSGNGALTSQQKILAAQVVIYEQTTKAQGDFARTSDGLANAQRILAAQAENLKITLGQALLPIVLQVASFINREVIPAFSAFVDGLTGRDQLNDALTDTESNTYQTGVALREMAISLGQVAAVFSGDGKSSLEGFTNAIKILAGIAQGVVTIFKEIVGFIIEMTNQVAKFLNLFGANISLINQIRGTAFSPITPSFSGGYQSGTGYNAPGTGGIGGGATGGAFTGGATGGAGGGGGGASGGGGGGGGTGGVFNLPMGAKSATDLVDRLTKVTESITDLTFQVATGGIGKAAAKQELDKLNAEFRVLEKQGENLAMLSTTPGSFNGFGGGGQGTPGASFTVNIGVVGDAESAARTIVDILNDSQARGGAATASNWSIS